MSYPSLAPYIMKRPWLMRWMRPLSEWYFDNAGYRKLGLRYVPNPPKIERRRHRGTAGMGANGMLRTVLTHGGETVPTT